MITLRRDKGYDLTHLELDENIRFFDNEYIYFSGVAKNCPEDDTWIVSIQKVTNSEYLILGDTAFDYGVMTSTPIDVSISAIIPYSNKTEFSMQITPVLFEDYSLAEEVEVPYNGSNEDTVILEFSNNIELIEISSDIAFSPSLVSKSGRYENGQIASLAEFTIGENYKATLGSESGKEIQFNVLSELPIPQLSTVSDTDPFGDSSQVHHFKFEGTATDENGNANILGTAYYSPISQYGSQSLKMASEKELTLSLENSDFATNGGFCIVYAGRRSEGSTFPSYGDPPNMFKYREMLTLQGGYGTIDIADELGIHQYIAGWIPEDSLLDRFGGELTSGWRFDPDPYVDTFEWYTVAENFYIKGSNIVKSAFGWGADHGNASWCQNDRVDKVFTSSISYPHTMHFNKALGYPTDWDNCEALIDGLRIFNRPLTMAQKVTLTQHLNGSQVYVYQTSSSEIGAYKRIYTINETAPLPSINIVVNDTDITFGNGILDIANNKIVFPIKVAIYGKRFSIKITPASGGFQGSNLKAKGYIYNG